MEIIFATGFRKFAIFPRESTSKTQFLIYLGDGIFSADYETWQKQKKTARIEFHSTKFRKFTVESLFELVYNRLIPVLDSSLKKSLSIDLHNILLRLTFDNVCMIAFDVDPGCSQRYSHEIPLCLELWHLFVYGRLRSFIT